MTKDQLFKKLANFLRKNVMLVADYNDSNAPWNLLEQLDKFERQQKTKKSKKS